MILPNASNCVTEKPVLVEGIADTGSDGNPRSQPIAQPEEKQRGY
jgi:hypothetical protein